MMTLYIVLLLGSINVAGSREGTENHEVKVEGESGSKLIIVLFCFVLYYHSFWIDK